MTLVQLLRQAGARLGHKTNIYDDAADQINALEAELAAERAGAGSRKQLTALEARCREREEYAAKLERRTDKSLTEHAAGCIADQERIAQLEVIARDVYNGFKKEAWEGANEYFNEHPEVNKHYGSPKETKGDEG